MGDLEACKHTVHSLETDLEARGVFEHAGMLGQGGIGVGFELFEQLILVRCRHRPVTARGFDPNVQGVVAVPFQVTLDRIDMNGEVTRCFLRCRSIKDQGNNPSPKFQPITVDACCIHSAIMPNALNALF